jgi:hypothetical protein
VVQIDHIYISHSLYNQAPKKAVPYENQYIKRMKQMRSGYADYHQAVHLMGGALDIKSAFV